MTKIFFSILFAFLAVFLNAKENETWLYKGNSLSFGCFTFQDDFVESYPDYYQTQFRLNKAYEDDFTSNPGKYFEGNINWYKKQAYGRDIESYGYGLAAVNLKECLTKKQDFLEDYQVREWLSKDTCKKLAPNLDATCKKAAYVVVMNKYGGSGNRAFMYVYGEFDKDGETFIVPLKKFNHYKDADRFVKNENKKRDLVSSNDSIDLKTSHEIVGNKLILTVKSKNLVDNGKGGISISFPQFQTTKRIIKSEKIGFDNVNLYKKGTKIWNREIRKTVRSSYLLSEGWTNKWRANEEKIIKLVVDISNLDKLVVHVRSNIINGKKEYVNPVDSTYYNQQGYYDKILNISLR